MKIIKIAILFIALFQFIPLEAQEWKVISQNLFSKIKQDTAFADDVLNRKTGALWVEPSGEVFLVLNGNHSIYSSKNQGKSWKPLKDVVTRGRAYGTYSINYDYTTGRKAIYMIVQKKRMPAQGLVLDENNRLLSWIGKPAETHDGWTWGMPAWNNPRYIIGKEHHAWVIMWLSKDGGENWQKLDFKSRNPGVVNENVFLAGNDDGIYRSTDQGKSFNKVSDFKTLGKNPVRYGDNFYWATEQGVVISSDEGANWKLLGESLPGVLYGPFFGKRESSLLVVNEEGLYISKNSGQSWQKIANYFAPPQSAHNGEYNVVHPTNSYGWDEERGIVYVAGLGGDVYKLSIEK